MTNKDKIYLGLAVTISLAYVFFMHQSNKNQRDFQAQIVQEYHNKINAGQPDAEVIEFPEA